MVRKFITPEKHSENNTLLQTLLLEQFENRTTRTYSNLLEQVGK